MLSAHAAAAPPVVAPRPPGAFTFMRASTYRTGELLSKEWRAPGYTFVRTGNPAARERSASSTHGAAGVQSSFSPTRISSGACGR